LVVLAFSSGMVCAPDLKNNRFIGGASLMKQPPSVYPQARL
jgi:hypothetical protein